MSSTPRILFVDDEQNVLDGLRRLLRDQRGQWEMFFQADATVAAAQVERDGIDVAVLDFNMPGRDGLAVLREIKENPATRDVEVILLTGNQEQDLKRRGLDLGVTDLLNKPARKEDLVARIRSLLRTRAYHLDLNEKNRLLERQLVKAQKMEVLGRMAAGAVHDVNNFLSTISGFASLLELQLEDHAEALETLERVTRASHHASRVVGQLVHLGQHDSDTRELMDLADLVRDNLDTIRHSMGPRIVLNGEVPDRPLLAEVNPSAFYQVMINLCVNAREAMPDGGTLTVSVDTCRVDAERPVDNLPAGPYQRLVIADTGVGMDGETIATLFTPLHAARAAHDGAQLGFPVVHSIVREHGGALTVASEPGNGTRVAVFLPAITVADGNPEPGDDRTRAGQPAAATADNPL